jgi:hypothetical protein
MTTYDLQQYPTDFHILGAPDEMGMKWYATGSFINDVGNETRGSISKKFNQYSLNAYVDPLVPDEIQI